MKLVPKLLATILVSVLALSLIPIAAVNLVSANVTGQAWTDSAQLTMQSQRFVADAWVTKDGEGATYEMWYSHIWPDVSLQELANRTAAPPAPPAPPSAAEQEEEEEVGEEPGVTLLPGDLVQDGEFMTEVTAEAEDAQSWVTVPEGTTGLTAEGEPLTFISVTEMEVPPPPPPDHTVVALTFTFGPEGATFDEEVAVTLTYSEAHLPVGLDENDLVIVVWDDLTGEWVELETVVDTVNNTVTTYVTHFSTFGVLAPSVPASFQISNLMVTPDEVEIGEEVTISVLVANTGDLSGTYTLQLKINDEVVEDKQVVLAGRGSVTASKTVSGEAGGVYAVTIGGLTGRFTVTVPPVVVPPEPADISTSDLSVTPVVAETGETITISVRVANRGGQEGTHLVELKIDGVVVETERVTLAAGASQTVTFATSQDNAAMYLVDIDDLSQSFTVERPEVVPAPGPNWPLIGGITGGVVLITTIAGILLWRRRGNPAGGA